MRPEKATIVRDLKAKLDSSPFLLLIDYTGMKVPHFAELRKRLAESGAECHVVKITLLEKALSEAGWPDPGKALSGQIAMITGPSDICAAAKAIKTFKDEFEKPEIRGGILDREILSIEQINALAELPAKPVLQAQLLSVLLAPATQLVCVLNEPAASLARVLKAKADKEGAAV
jgi:large subunit ribosomal protein L10